MITLWVLIVVYASPLTADSVDKNYFKTKDACEASLKKVGKVGVRSARCEEVVVMTKEAQ